MKELADTSVVTRAVKAGILDIERATCKRNSLYFFIRSISKTKLKEDHRSSDLRKRFSSAATKREIVSVSVR